ncbi:hypothetical protein BUALT_Bualt14G0023300 [Buddleja alternifolia]|uniref:Protein FAR1-RELATED SEQUENCE n=1 Tax=Buddleja alternifolia TaxID=168488 RepID=A0AAV6WMG5_9LAMI|nr:hypothetical protein BUALT_Bualt14G0023300 [Buddleja alternifolia]
MGKDICVDYTIRHKLDFHSYEVEKETNELEAEKETNESGEELVPEVHSTILEEKIPKIGMEFVSEKAAYNFYNVYAKLAGFGIRRHYVHRDVKGNIIDMMYCCACQAGGRENFGFILEDYKNYLRSKRTIELKIGDTRGVLEYLQQRQLDGPNFFYAIQVDEDDLIANILWVDAQMKVDYSYFGDVVCFDTTYRKNKERRQFALFVGVNHHKQTTVFGTALLYDETFSTFMWLLDNFARAMLEKKPKTILTNQDVAMAKALATEWPETCHRLCIWHIYQNVAIHLSSVFTHFTSFSKDFSSCVYDYEEEEDFLNAWQEMLEKYGLQTNEWLERLFKIRKKWALVYGQQSFCADMTTTQRSERILCSHALKVLSSRNIVEIPELYIKKRRTKKAKKKNIVEAQPIGASVPSESMNEQDEKKRIVAQYKELCSLHNQLVTRAALTDETFRIAKSGLLKMIGEVDATLKNKTLVRPTLGPKFVIQKNLVSYSIEDVLDEAGNASNDIL